jgi:hypothetical protein
MLYLTGASGPKSRDLAKRRPLGLMVQPLSGYERQIRHYRWWAADNGQFTPATAPDDAAWLAWLDRLPREHCLFVAVPDVCRRPDGELGGDPVATWERFQILAPKARAAGFRVALVAQDGIETMDLRPQLAAADAIFLGGSTEWKIGLGLEVADVASMAGCWTHMGRVNTAERYELACRHLVDSADGTFLKYGPDINIRRLERWVLRGAQLRLKL